MQRSPEGAAINYYERHLGDYARDTAHLTMVEHGAYTLLLDRYYATEAPIPADQAHRVARARTKEERAAVDAVLSEYFVLSDDGWRNARCDKEIARFRELEPDREHKRENAKERQKRARDARRDLFAKLRDHGIVPHYETSTSELRAHLSRVTEQSRARDATATSHQTPDTIPKEKAKEEAEAGAKALVAEKPATTKKGTRIAVDWTPSETDLAYAAMEAPGIDAKREAERFRDYWLGQPSAKATSPDWSARWRTWIRNAVEFSARSGARASPISLGERVRQSAEDFGNFDFRSGSNAR